LDFEVNGRTVAERTVQASAVVKHFYKIKDGLAGLLSGFEVAAVDQFLFERAPEGFHGGIIGIRRCRAWHKPRHLRLSFPECGSAGPESGKARHASRRHGIATVGRNCCKLVWHCSAFARHEVSLKLGGRLTSWKSLPLFRTFNAADPVGFLIDFGRRLFCPHSSLAGPRHPVAAKFPRQETSWFSNWFVGNRSHLLPLLIVFCFPMGSAICPLNREKATQKQGWPPSHQAL
jgi:hypothetical protein